jgi:hypothetical protein
MRLVNMRLVRVKPPANMLQINFCSIPAERQTARGKTAGVRRLTLA